MGTPKTVLVFDLNFLGDMLMSSPVMRALKDHGVERVDVIAYDFCYPILVANPYIDAIWIVLHKNPFHVWRRALEARRRKYDLILQLNTSLKTNILMWIAGGKERLGYDYRGLGFLNTIRVPIAQRTARKGRRTRECLDLLEKGLGWKCKNEGMVYVGYTPASRTGLR
jgi:ADP-heptose:LPS heptosyltransferase